MTEPTQINARLEAVSELKDNEARIGTLRKALEPLKMLDLEKLVALIATYDPKTSFIGSGRSLKQLSELDPAREADKNLSKVFQLRQFMTAIPALKSALDVMQSETLTRAGQLLAKDEMDKILREINDTLNPDMVAQGAFNGNQFGSRTNKGEAVRP